MSDNAQLTGLCDRFRGFYPVVIDVETAGFNAKTDALLEIAAITLKMDEQGWLMPDTTLHFHVEPFVGANLQPEALAFNGIDPNDPDRGAVSEYEALHEIFKVVRKGIKASGCNPHDSLHGGYNSCVNCHARDKEITDNQCMHCHDWPHNPAA